jgi:isocitrate dehydrogenase
VISAPAPLPASKPGTTAVVVIKDRIADSMFQQALLRPSEYSVLATTNLNGDYMTYDLERQMEGATKLKTSEFARAIVENV